jgi:hypothetical protein
MLSHFFYSKFLLLFRRGELKILKWQERKRNLEKRGDNLVGYFKMPST